VIELIVHDNFVAIDGEQVKILINFDLPVDMEGKPIVTRIYTE
jgi:hypothetical protein